MSIAREEEADDLGIISSGVEVILSFFGLGFVGCFEKVFWAIISIDLFAGINGGNW